MPMQRAELHESLALAFLVLLEQLTPLERAVFLLREVFDYEYAEIAAIVGKAEGACRQLLSRAKKHIVAARPRFKPSPEAHRQIFTQFLRAAQPRQAVRAASCPACRGQRSERRQLRWWFTLHRSSCASAAGWP